MRTVEPENILFKVVDMPRRQFLKKQNQAIAYNGPVLPQIQDHLEEFIIKVWASQESFVILYNSYMMERTENSRSDASVKRHIVINPQP